MNLRLRALIALLVMLTAVEARGATCESLQTLSLRDGTVTLAQPVAAGAFSAPATGPMAAQQAAVFKQLPAFCRVAVILRPTSQSEIRIEVWMPLSGWNGKFQGVGNGGFAGTIMYATGRGVERGMAGALSRGYATASTDTGHVAEAGTAFLGNTEKLVDFSYRAVHEMTIAAKAIVAAFYGTGPKRSYWNGCSLGGRQALMEAQRFPDDYDGIIAGAPANPQTDLTTWSVYAGQVALKNPANTIPASKFPMIHQAVLDACDALDALKDGLIDDPRRCHFDFKPLACTGEDSPSCLTDAQVQTARAVTTPLVHAKTGKKIFPGLALGTERGWAVRIGGPEPNPLGTEFLKYAVFKNPNWDWRTFDLETAVAAAAPLAKVTDATNPDLTRFQRRGGKLLLFHGWADQNFSAESTIDYYERVRKTMGSQTSDWMRLFLAPGMGHCGAGQGPNEFDAVSALEQWVEHNRPPASMVATYRPDGKIVRTRPLCPYPQVATYQGTGSIDDAANFRCQ